MAKSAKRWLLLALVVGILLVSGCVKIQIKEEIGLLGTSDFSMRIEALNVSAFGWDKKNPCDDFNASSSSPLFTGAKCSFDGKAETITGKFDRKKAGGLTITGTKYRFDFVKALDGFNDKKNKSSTQMALQEKKNATLVKQYKDEGIRYDYVVKLPGKITGHSGCEIQSDGSCKFDLLELEAKDNPYVESDTSLLGGLLGGPSQDKPSGKTTQTTLKGQKGKTTKGGSNIPCMPALTLLMALAGTAAAKAL